MRNAIEELNSQNCAMGLANRPASFAPAARNFSRNPHCSSAIGHPMLSEVAIETGAKPLACQVHSILAVLSPPREADLILSWADAIAARHSAIIDAAIIRPDWTSTYGFTPYGYGPTPVVLDQLVEESEQIEKTARTVFDKHAKATPSLQYRRFLQVSSNESRGVSSAGQTVDLTIALRGAKDALDGQQELLIGELALDGGACVFTPPAGIDPTGQFPHIAIAWDGSREASRAVRDAQPFLQQADKITLLTLGTGGLSPSVIMDAEHYLSAMGLNAVAHMIDKPSGDEGKTLLDHATAQRADLLVMGAYGQARWRERMFGGVTHHAVTHAEIPLLLSH